MEVSITEPRHTANSQKERSSEKELLSDKCFGPLYLILHSSQTHPDHDSLIFSCCFQKFCLKQVLFFCRLLFQGLCLFLSFSVFLSLFLPLSLPLKHTHTHRYTTHTHGLSLNCVSTFEFDVPIMIK